MSDPLEQLQKLADLKSAGVLTDAEFAAKKAELLALVGKPAPLVNSQSATSSQSGTSLQSGTSAVQPLRIGLPVAGAGPDNPFPPLPARGNSSSNSLPETASPARETLPAELAATAGRVTAGGDSVPLSKSELAAQIDAAERELQAQTEQLNRARAESRKVQNQRRGLLLRQAYGEFLLEVRGFCKDAPLGRLGVLIVSVALSSGCGVLVPLLVTSRADFLLSGGFLGFLLGTLACGHLLAGPSDLWLRQWLAEVLRKLQTLDPLRAQAQAALQDAEQRHAQIHKQRERLAAQQQERADAASPPLPSQNSGTEKIAHKSTPANTTSSSSGVNTTSQIQGEENPRRRRWQNYDWHALKEADFLRQLMLLFTDLGYEVEALHGSADHRVHLLVKRGPHRLAVHARADTAKIGAQAVREVCAGMLKHQCQFCAVLTNREFTREAREAAVAQRCLLIDAPRLAEIAMGRFRWEEET